MYRFRTLSKEIWAFYLSTFEYLKMGFTELKSSTFSCMVDMLARFSISIVTLHSFFDLSKIAQLVNVFWLKAYSIGKSTLHTVCNSNWKLKQRQNLLVLNVLNVQIMIYFFYLLTLSLILWIAMDNKLNDSKNRKYIIQNAMSHPF